MLYWGTCIESIRKRRDKLQVIDSLLTSQYFWFFPPPKYHPKPQRIFWLCSPLQNTKNTNTDTNTKDNFFKWQTQRQKRLLPIFPSVADYQFDALLFIFPNVQMCKCANVTCKKLNMTWHDIFLQMWRFHDFHDSADVTCKNGHNPLFHAKVDTMPFSIAIANGFNTYPFHRSCKST